MGELTGTKTVQNNRELWSKLTDGVLASAVLVLLWLTVALAARPITLIFGPPGLLIYILGLLAVSMFSLQQALVPGRLDTTRAWYGMTGGFLAWAVAEMNKYLGAPVMTNLAGFVPLIMVALIVSLLWRNVLPVGVRFFSLTFLLNWAEHVFMRIEELLAEFSPVFKLMYRGTGYLAILLAVFALVWILFKARRRIHRVGGALMVWFLVSLALYAFRGALF